MLEREPCRSLGEEWFRKKLNVVTLREKLNKPFLNEEAKKGTRRIQCGGSKNICSARV